MDVGPFESEHFHVAEVDEQGRRRRAEWFRPDRLGDAIACLYERYAELLPEDPRRERAARVARGVAAWTAPPDLERYASTVAPAVAVVDRRLLSLWSAQGAEQFLQHWRSQFEVAAPGNVRDEEVFALTPDAFLVRRTWSGILRAGGGTYESRHLCLFAFGADGLLARVEVFEADAEDEALARFDALAGGARPTRRRVRPNAAAEHEARAEAIHAQDGDALAALTAERVEIVDHGVCSATRATARCSSATHDRCSGLRTGGPERDRPAPCSPRRATRSHSVAARSAAATTRRPARPMR